MAFNSELDLTFTRDVDAPCPVIWKDWTGPVHLIESTREIKG